MVIHCEEKFNSTREYSKSLKDTTLSDCFKRLEKYEKLEHVPGLVVNLYSDYCKYSFYFVINRPDGSMYMNGGILYHGSPGEPDNSFAVCIEGRVFGWRMHT